MGAVAEIVKKQRAFFETGKTKDLKFRVGALGRLYRAVCEEEERLLAALKKDLNKPAFEARSTETGMIKAEIGHLIKNLDRWTKPCRAGASFVSFPSSGRVYTCPYGVVLIMAPWNYPLQLSLIPLAGAIAAGNCAVVKLSQGAPACAAAVKELLGKCFPEEYAAAVTGAPGVNEELLEEKYDFLFFTGSPAAGREVMEKAARTLTPVCLELGGKSPCVVDETADVVTAARRIVWGKFLNAGQTCVAPDYVLVQEEAKEELLRQIVRCVEKFYPLRPELAEKFPHIVNERHFSRLLTLMEGEQAVIGGGWDRQALFIEPTVLDQVSWDSPVMQEEIFGPLLPVLAYRSWEEALSRIRAMPRPLAFYYFTGSRNRARRVFSEVECGGGCVNDTILHLTAQGLPFGGVGNSGMGRYHGKYSVDTFSYRKGVLWKPARPDLLLRYPPYTKLAEKAIRYFLK